MGGKYNVMHQTSSKIMDSFGDTTNIPQTPPSVQQQIIPQLKLAPKWMKRPCGVSFAFGGKLVTFNATSQLNSNNNNNLLEQQQAQSVDPSALLINTQRVVISQVVTDLDLIDKSQHLESTLQTGNLIEYCNYKIEIAENGSAEQNIWRFILASFGGENKYEKFIQLLGFDNDNLKMKLDQVLVEPETENNKQPAQVHLNGFTDVFDQIKLKDREQEEKKEEEELDLNFTNETDNLLSESLALGNVEAVVDLCIKESRYTEAILIANCFDNKQLLAKVQRHFFQSNNNNKFAKLLEKVINRDWFKIVQNCNLKHWKESLSLIMMYTRDEELSQLCDKLGERLEKNNDLLDACICYVCSENLDNFVSCWEKLYNKIATNETSNNSTSAELQVSLFFLRV